MTSVAVLERLSIVTPLGVRFRDEATGAYVTEGLVVALYPAAIPERRIDGLSNRASAFVFSNLPGMREIEQGDGDGAFWAAHPPQFDFVLEMRDLSGHFLPFTKAIKLPQRGIVTLPLYSSPARPAPVAMGTLRATLIDAVTRKAAAWALLEAQAGEQRLVTGMADVEGRLMLPLFYPKPVIVLGSPGSAATPLTQQTWAVGVTVRYRTRDPIPSIPDLGDVLAQPAASAWLQTSPATAWTQGTLRIGRDLVPADSNGTAMPSLLITPAGSPP